jgi:uncharacterized protein (DUF305 family)
MFRPEYRRLIAALVGLLTLIVTLPISGGAALTTPTPDPHHPATTVATTAVATRPDNPCATAASGTTMAEMAQTGAMMGSPMAGMANMTPGAMDPTMMAQFDLMFIDMMIPHHESAVAMANVARARAERDEIRQLAEAIIATQTAEIERLREWRAAWYGDGQPMMAMDQMMGMMGQMMQSMPNMQAMEGMANKGDMMSMMDMMGMAMSPGTEIAALCAAPGSFDLAFIDAMIPHHQTAVMMAQVALANAQHDELKALARAIIDAQQQEIQQMLLWRAAWSGTATPAA